MIRSVICILIFLPLSVIGQANSSPEKKLKRYKSIRHAIRNPEKVKFLDLSDKGIKELPKEILMFNNLQVLKASRNKIETVPAFVDSLKNLETLILSHNTIREFPNHLSRLNKLRLLDLSSNKIKSLDFPISGFGRLEYLDLSFNEVNEKQIEQLRKILQGCIVRGYPVL